MKDLELKCTQGNWEARRDDCHYDTVSDIYAGGKFIASVGGDVACEEQEANTRLMAAAPKMLRALMEIRENLSILRIVDTGSHAWDLANKAIQKAEGNNTIALYCKNTCTRRGTIMPSECPYIECLSFPDRLMQ